MSVIEIPIADVSSEALLGVVKAHVLREGTDYGQVTVQFDVKVNSLLSQLQSGKAILLYDPLEECCHILLNEEWQRLKQTLPPTLE